MSVHDAIENNYEVIMAAKRVAYDTRSALCVSFAEANAHRKRMMQELSLMLVCFKSGQENMEKKWKKIKKERKQDIKVINLFMAKK